MANAHSHAFQLDLRGVAERPHPGDDFWSWRNEMYRLAGSHDPDSMRAVGERVYAQMAAAGYGAIGEFHYVVHQPDGTPYDEPNTMAIALAEAAVAQGLEIVLLPAAYNRGGFGRPPDEGQRRFCDPEVSVFLERLDALRAWASGRPGVDVGVGDFSPSDMTSKTVSLALGDVTVAESALRWISLKRPAIRSETVADRWGGERGSCGVSRGDVV